MNKTYLRSVGISLGLFAGTFILEAQQSGAGAAGGGAAASGTLNTIGGASIAQPAAPTVGNASALQANPNTVGGTINNGGITGLPPGAAAGATLPTGVAGTAQPVQFNTLPAP